MPFWRAYRLWLRNDCVDLSAAFAYHGLQSFFPVLLIALALASQLLGTNVGLNERLIGWAAEVLPESAIAIFSATLIRFTRQGFGAGLLGVLALLLTSSNAYLTLQRGADRLWWNRPQGLESLTWQQIVVRFVQFRLKAIGLICLISGLITFDQLFASRRMLGSIPLRDWFVQFFQFPFAFHRPVSMGLDLLISLSLCFFTSWLLLWALPSRRIPWRILLPGAVWMALSVTFINVLLGRVLLALGLRFQAYGVVGGVLVLTLWVWLIGVVIYYAQCLSFVLHQRPRGMRMVNVQPS
ncbi:YihY/virulence factor BrkB family protein [Cyanobium sp. WAJ14-Wanaka]|uniref:YihY/virulence factor BrkB family protein n=1 Tax=Cyanobium sp. WAJ14-Wanaka TaxID=2823725 RepID=UPI0020CEB359|nr:YihY/virulence factor BrkB family protein [Cyanobium sp. WAJ14-Wanaka]